MPDLSPQTFTEFFIENRKLDLEKAGANIEKLATSMQQLLTNYQPETIAALKPIEIPEVGKGLDSLATEMKGMGDALKSEHPEGQFDDLVNALKSIIDKLPPEMKKPDEIKYKGFSTNGTITNKWIEPGSIQNMPKIPTFESGSYDPKIELRKELLGKPTLTGLPGDVTTRSISIPQLRLRTLRTPEFYDPKFEQAPVLNVSPAPVFTPGNIQLPEVVMPSVPEFVAPEMPVIHDFTIPTLVEPVFRDPKVAPTLDLPAPPDIGSIAMPQLSQVQLPVFDVERPDATFAAPDATLQYTELLEFSKEVTRLRELVFAETGSYGLTVDDEHAVWGRAKDREVAAFNASNNALVANFARLGFGAPPLAAARMQETEYLGLQDKLNTVSRDIAGKRAEMIAQYRTNMINASIQFESRILDYVTAYHERILKAQMATADAALAVFRASVEAFNAKVQMYQADAQVFVEKIKAVGLQLDQDRLRLEAAQLQGTLNEMAVRIYETRVRAVNTVIDVYNAELQGTELYNKVQAQRFDVFSKRLEVVMAQIQADEARLRIYDTQVRAQMAPIEVAKVRIDAERSKLSVVEVQAQIERARTDAYIAQVQGRSAEVAAYGEQMRAYETTVKAELGKAEAKRASALAALEVDLTAYKAELELQQSAARISLEAQSTQSQQHIQAQAVNNDTKLKVAMAKFQAEVESGLTAFKGDLEAQGITVRAKSEAEAQLVRGKNEVALSGYRVGVEGALTAYRAMVESRLASNKNSLDVQLTNLKSNLEVGLSGARADLDAQIAQARTIENTNNQLLATYSAALQQQRQAVDRLSAVADVVVRQNTARNQNIGLAMQAISGAANTSAEAAKISLNAQEFDRKIDYERMHDNIQMKMVQFHTKFEDTKALMDRLMEQFQAIAQMASAIKVES